MPKWSIINVVCWCTPTESNRMPWYCFSSYALYTICVELWTWIVQHLVWIGLLTKTPVTIIGNQFVRRTITNIWTGSVSAMNFTLTSPICALIDIWWWLCCGDDDVIWNLINKVPVFITTIHYTCQTVLSSPSLRTLSTDIGSSTFFVQGTPFSANCCEIIIYIYNLLFPKPLWYTIKHNTSAFLNLLHKRCSTSLLATKI